LFPNAPQLLHIFEPRYRDMLRDCLAGDQRFGLSLLSPERADRPAPGDVGCRARVEQYRLLPDGRYNILAVGEERYVLQDIVFSETQYLVGAVEFFFDDDDAASLDELAGNVRRQFDAFVASWRELQDFVTAPGDIPSDPTDLSFHVSANLEADPDTQEELLRLTSTRMRLQRLLALLETENANRQTRVDALRLARGNGHGPHEPDIVDQ
jgi:Lon protease-like protein